MLAREIWELQSIPLKVAQVEKRYLYSFPLHDYLWFGNPILKSQQSKRNRHYWVIIFRQIGSFFTLHGCSLFSGAQLRSLDGLFSFHFNFELKTGDTGDITMNLRRLPEYAGPRFWGYKKLT